MCSCDVGGKGAVKTPCGAAKIVEEWLQFMGQLQRECMCGAGPRVREAGLHILTVAQMVSPQTFDVKLCCYRFAICPSEFWPCFDLTFP